MDFKTALAIELKQQTMQFGRGSYVSAESMSMRRAPNTNWRRRPEPSIRAGTATLDGNLNSRLESERGAYLKDFARRVGKAGDGSYRKINKRDRYSRNAKTRRQARGVLRRMEIEG